MTDKVRIVALRKQWRGERAYWRKRRKQLASRLFMRDVATWYALARGWKINTTFPQRKSGTQSEQRERVAAVTQGVARQIGKGRKVMGDPVEHMLIMLDHGISDESVKWRADALIKAGWTQIAVIKGPLYGTVYLLFEREKVAP